MHIPKYINTIISGAYILTAMLIINMAFQPPKQIVSVYSPKKFKTTAELKAEVIEKKLTRRAKGWAKPDKPSGFLKFHQSIRIKDGEQSSGYGVNFKFEELEKARNRKLQFKSATEKLNWTERGPGNVSGRTRGLIIDPDDPTGNTWFTGSVGGGIWKTTNAGNSWTNLTPNFPTLSTVTIAMAESNRQIIYAGTGEGFGNVDAIIGDGIFKTYNKGETWQQLASTVKNTDFLYVNRLVVDPKNDKIVIAVTNTSIQKTIDGGSTWKKVFGVNRKIQHVVPDPNDFNTLYASVQGKGVIKSTNKGESWSSVLENNAGRIELAVSPSKPDVVYALNENSELFVSNDKGSNWTPSIITSGTKEKFLSGQGWYDNTLAVDPANENIILIGGVNLFQATTTKTSETPISMAKVDTIGTRSFMDFVNFGADHLGGGMEVTTFNKTYKTIEIQFGPGKKQRAHRFKVPDGSTSGVPAGSYTYLDYVEVPFQAWDIENNRQLMVSFRDQDNNRIFNLTPHDDDALIGREYIYVNDINYSTTPSTLIAKKGGHVHEELAFAWPVLAINSEWNPANLPTSKITITRSDVYAKELDSKKIADWVGRDAPYVHADFHNIQFTKTNTGATRIVVANDGGVGFSDDNGNSWKNPTNGFNTTQFYGIDKHPTQERYIGGMQDNGSWYSFQNPNKLSKWVEATGGDGFDAVWHATDPQKMITSIYNNALYYSGNGGSSWSSISSDLADQGETKAPFVTQIGYTTTDPDKIYIVGSSGVSHSNNFGQSWQVSKMTEGTWGWSGNGYVEPSLANPEVVWAASRMSENGKMHVSVDGGKTFTATNNYTELMGILSGLATHPTNERCAYALFSFAGDPKILRTTDMGKNWEDISRFVDGKSTNGFPDVAVYSLLVMPYNTNILWAGTEIGLFVSTDNGKNWEYADNGLPAVSIWEMKIRGNQVVVATHGRGVWSVNIPQLENAVKAPTLLAAGIAPSNRTNIKFMAGSLYDSLSIVIDSIKYRTISNLNFEQGTVTLAFDLRIEEGEYSMQLIGYKNGSLMKSAIKNVLLFNLNESSETYSNDFENESDDFIGSGFSIMNYPSLGEGKAIHTEHPYADNQFIAYYLKTPIIVKGASNSNTTVLTYRDIPMIEEGEQGILFGNPDFYDYVVAEGSKNGIDWIPLANGYDFSTIKNRATNLGISIDAEPTPALFTNREVSLLNKFIINDTILIRFSLFSDPHATGWGWVIDDINIYRARILGSEKKSELITRLYPIPCNQEITLELSRNFQDSAEIIIYDVNGKKVQQHSMSKQTRLTINTAMLKPSVYIMEIRAGIHYEQKRFQVAR